MLRAYKTEIHPTPQQAAKIRQTLGVCRFIYNFYISENEKSYENQQGVISAYSFSKWLNNDFLPKHPEYAWIKSVNAHAIQHSMLNAETAFKKFLKKQACFLRFKKKSQQWKLTAYFPRNNKTDWTVERHRVKIPTLGYVRLKEKCYVPVNANVRSGTVSMRAGRYFVSVLIEEPDYPQETLAPDGIGIDLGIKTFAVCSDGRSFPNINKFEEIKKLEKRLNREQRRLSRKCQKHKKGESAQNIEKQKLKVGKLYFRLDCIRKDFLNKCIHELVKTKPAYIALENLNVSGMLKNRHLSKAIHDLGFYTFRQKLIGQCMRYHVPVRLVSRWYPSSKTCHNCGFVKRDLKLSERQFTCPSCGTVTDRDFQAALNIRDCTEYQYIC